MMFQIKNRVVLTWAISYLLLLAIPIIIGGIQITNVKKIIENEYIMYSSQMQKDISQKLNDIIGVIKTNSRLISNNGIIDAYIQSNSPASSIDHIRRRDIANFVNSSRTYSDMSDCYLYVKDENVIFSSSSVIPRELINEYPFKGNIIQSLNFNDYVDTYHSYTIDTVEDQQTNERRIMLITSLPATAYFSPQATLFHIIKPSAIDSAIENVAVDSNIDVWLINTEGEMISNRLNKMNEPKLDMSTFMEPSGQVEAVVDGEKSLIYYSSLTSVPQFMCVLVVPLSVFNQKTAHIRFSNFIFVIFSIILGIMLASFALYRNYQPVSRIINQIDPQFHKKDQDAFKQISNTISSYVHDNNELSMLYEQHKAFLHDKFLESVFQEGIVDSPATREILSSFGMIFQGNLFCVLVMMSVQENQKETTTELIQLFSNFDQRLNEKQSEIKNYGLVMNNQLVVLVNFKTSALKGYYSSFIDEVAAWSNQNEVITSVSKICFNLNNVNICYQETSNQLYRNWMNYKKNNYIKNYFIQNEDAQKEISNYRLQESDLYRLICSGDSQQALKTVFNILDNKTNSLFPDNNVAKDYSLINILWKAVYDMPDIDDATIVYVAELSNSFIQNNNESRVKTMTTLIEYICTKFSKMTFSSNQPLISRITECVQMNYMKCDFNVSNLAEILGMNISYLSRYFKSNTGIGLLDYINRVRIEKGKSLMSNPSVNVSQIAKQVGFDNINSFIRVFKKYERRTPGDYMIESKNQ